MRPLEDVFHDPSYSRVLVQAIPAHNSCLFIDSLLVLMELAVSLGDRY